MSTRALTHGGLAATGLPDSSPLDQGLGTTDTPSGMCMCVCMCVHKCMYMLVVSLPRPSPSY